MLIERQRIRTYHCAVCDAVVSTAVRVCRTCGDALSFAESEAAADWEDRVLDAGHDAQYVYRAALACYGWYAVLVYLVWQGWIDFDSERWLYQPEVQAILYAALVVVPFVLGYALWHIVRWQRTYGDLSAGEPRGFAARRTYRRARWHWMAACAMYVVMVVTPLALLWLGIPLRPVRALTSGCSGARATQVRVTSNAAARAR